MHFLKNMWNSVVGFVTGFVAKPNAVAAVAAVATAGLIAAAPEAAHAASVLDATMTTSVTTGFTDIKDTVKDVLTIAFPYILGIVALLASPKIVKKMISIAGAK